MTSITPYGFIFQNISKITFELLSWEWKLLKIFIHTGFPLWCVKCTTRGWLPKNRPKMRFWKLISWEWKLLKMFLLRKKKPSGTLESQISFENLIFGLFLGNHPRVVNFTHHDGNPVWMNISKHFKNHVWTPELRMKTFENIFVAKKNQVV